MNPISLILIGLGLILIYVGWKGSQHTVFATLLGHNTSSTTAKKTSNTSGSTSTSQPTSTNASTGNNGSSVESV